MLEKAPAETSLSDGAVPGSVSHSQWDVAQPRGSASLRSFALGAASWPNPQAEGRINTAPRCNGAPEVLDTLWEDLG